MAQSPEYPDLLWIPPRSYTPGRPTDPRVIVNHTTEGSETIPSARNGAEYCQRRTDGTSAHYFIDPREVVHCVRTKDQAHTARRNGNRIGIHYEFCGRAGQTTAQWDDDDSNAILRNAARQAARDAKKYGIPVVKLTAAQVRAGAKGFCGHVDITHAFPEDHGDHTDPGKYFPWDEYLALVKQELEEDDMPTAAEVAKAVWEHSHPHPTNAGQRQSKGTVMQYMDNVHVAQTAQVLAAVKALSDKMGQPIDIDEDAIVVGVLAGLTPERLTEAVKQAGLTPEILAAMIPDDMAQRVADELAGRLAA